MPLTASSAGCLCSCTCYNLKYRDNLIMVVLFHVKFQFSPFFPENLMC
jgi:hypothetical protein